MVYELQPSTKKIFNKLAKIRKTKNQTWNDNERKTLDDKMMNIKHKLARRTRNKRRKRMDKLLEDINNLSNGAAFKHANPRKRSTIEAKTETDRELIRNHYLQKSNIKDSEPSESETAAILDKYKDLFANVNDYRDNDCFKHPVTLKEVVNEAKKIKLNSAGPDNVTPYIIKIMAQNKNTNELITNLVNKILSNPSEYDYSGIIHPIPKTPTPKKLKDYRPITVLNAVTRFTLAIITNRLKTFIDENKIIHTAQQAFVQGARTITNAATLQRIIDMRPSRSKKASYKAIRWLFFYSI